MVGAAVKPTVPPLQAQKPRPNPPQREPGSSPRKPGRPGPIIRIAISLWIVWHFTGVFLAALCIPATSPLVVNIAQQPPMQWYLDALYLNQGHSFFAPDVGPGHFIEYKVFDQSGREIEHGDLPSKKDHWPRLFYHRHMMLADQSEMQSPDTQFNDYWQRKYLESYARHLLRVNENARVVQMRRIAHWPVQREDFAENGMKLTDSRTYKVTMEVTQRRSDLGPPPGSQSLNWQNNRAETARRWSGGPR